HPSERALPTVGRSGPHSSGEQRQSPSPAPALALQAICQESSQGNADGAIHASSAPAHPPAPPKIALEDRAHAPVPSAPPSEAQDRSVLSIEPGCQAKAPHAPPPGRCPELRRGAARGHPSARTSTRAGRARRNE